MCMEIDKISVISVHIYIYMWEYSTSSGYLSKQTIKDPQKQKQNKAAQLCQMTKYQKDRTKVTT